MSNNKENEWFTHAECKNVDTNVFFEGRTDTAKQYCKQCVVQQQCLAYAYKYDIEYGVFGGLTRRERDAVKRKKRQQTNQ